MDLLHKNQSSSSSDCKNLIPFEKVEMNTLFLRNDTFDEVMVKQPVEFLPLGLALWVVCVFGLFGNLLSAVVLRRPKMKSTYSILTLGLTFCDIIYLLMKLLRYGLLSMFEYLEVTNTYTEGIHNIHNLS